MAGQLSLAPGWSGAGVKCPLLWWEPLGGGKGSGSSASSCGGKQRLCTGNEEWSGICSLSWVLGGCHWP